MSSPPRAERRTLDFTETCEGGGLDLREVAARDGVATDERGKVQVCGTAIIYNRL